MTRGDSNNMDNSQKEVAEAPEGHSKFISRLSAIPLVHLTVCFALDMFTKAKNSVWILGKASDFVTAGMDRLSKILSPLIAQVRPIAAAPLARVDNLATKGLDTLERTVPVITKQPQEIVSETKEIISSRVKPAADRLNKASEEVLSSRVGQITLGCYEKVLSGGSSVVNSILPAGKEEQPNGFPHEKAPESVTARPAWLFRESLYLLTSTTQRLFGIAQSRADSVVHSVKKTL